jgi:hypothetical protein
MGDSLLPSKPKRNYAKILVIMAVVVGSAIIIYVAVEQSSAPTFPVQQKPFDEYASVVSSVFNGTEYSFKVEWTAGGNYSLLFAQMTSSTSVGNSPICSVGIRSIATGQVVDLPFSLSSNASSLADVGLSLAVQSVGNGSQFTIQYRAGNATAVVGDIQPSTYACFPPPSDMEDISLPTGGLRAVPRAPLP